MLYTSLFLSKNSLESSQKTAYNKYLAIFPCPTLPSVDSRVSSAGGVTPISTRKSKKAPSVTPEYAPYVPENTENGEKSQKIPKN